MKFSALVKEAREWLQREGRVSYRALRREFELDDDALEELKEELLYAHAQSVEDDGRGLVWNGEAKSPSTARPAFSQPQAQPPATYTPQHLAER